MLPKLAQHKTEKLVCDVVLIDDKFKVSNSSFEAGKMKRWIPNEKVGQSIIYLAVFNDVGERNEWHLKEFIDL